MDLAHYEVPWLETPGIGECFQLGGENLKAMSNSPLTPTVLCPMPGKECQVKDVGENNKTKKGMHVCKTSVDKTENK